MHAVVKSTKPQVAHARNREEAPSLKSPCTRSWRSIKPQVAHARSREEHEAV